MKELRKMIKSENNSKTVPFWDVPMELLKMFVNPNTVYKTVPWGLGADKTFYEPVMGQRFSVHKKVISHTDGQ